MRPEYYVKLCIFSVWTYDFISFQISFHLVFSFKTEKIIVHWTVKIFTSVLSFVWNHKNHSNPSYPWFSPIFKSTLDKLNVRFSWTYLAT